MTDKRPSFLAFRRSVNIKVGLVVMISEKPFTSPMEPSTVCTGDWEVNGGLRSRSNYTAVATIRVICSQNQYICHLMN